MKPTPSHVPKMFFGQLYALGFAVLLALSAAAASAQQVSWQAELDQSVRSMEAKALPSALTSAQRALALFEASSDRKKGDRGLVLGQIGRVHSELGDYVEAEAYFLRALAADEEAYGRDSRNLSATLMYLAGNYIDRKEYASAESTYHRLLKIMETPRGAKTGESVEVLRAIATSYRLQGRFSEAESTIRRILGIWPVKVLGVKFDGTAFELQNLAALRVYVGRYEDAISLHLRALQLLEQELSEAQSSSIGPGNGTYGRLVTCLERLTALNRRVGKQNEADEFERKAAVYRMKISPPVFELGRPASWGQALFPLTL